MIGAECAVILRLGLFVAFKLLPVLYFSRIPLQFIRCIANKAGKVTHG